MVPVILKKIDVFQAITRKKKAWDSVTPETIQKCFKQCAFQIENKVKMKMVGLFLFYMYAQVLLIANIFPSY